MEKEDSDSEPFSVSQSRLLYRSCMATGMAIKKKKKNTVSYNYKNVLNVCYTRV